MAKGKQSAPARSNPAPARGPSQAVMRAFAASNPNSRTAAAMSPSPAAAAPATAKPASTPAPEVKGVGQGLRIAGGDGGITRGELNTIMNASKMDSGKVIQNLDAVNAKLRANDKTGINLRSGAANLLINQASKAPPKGRWSPTVDFGKGAIGKALQGMLGSVGSGGYINPQSGQQMFTPGVAPTLLARGMDLMPSGRQTVRGMGKQYQVPERFMPKTEAAPGDTSTVGGGDGTDGINDIIPPTVEDIPKEEETKQDININMPGSPLDLASWATGFKTARSSRKRAGRSAQGLASNRVAPTRNVLGI
jgi:hypothetical protein